VFSRLFVTVGVIIATLLTKKTKGSEEPFDYDLKQVQVLPNWLIIAIIDAL